MLRILAPVRLVGLPGSLREASYSRATLVGLRNNLPEKVELDILDPRLPLYSEDEDGPQAPAQVKKLREAIGGSAGIVIATPEYNHGIPGVLKNALDWASRPYGKSCLINKPALVISISPAFTGGARAHAQANDTLLSIPADLMGGPQIVIGGIDTKVSDGALVDRPSLTFALAALRRMVTLVRRSAQRQFA